MVCFARSPTRPIGRRLRATSAGRTRLGSEVGQIEAPTLDGFRCVAEVLSFWLQRRHDSTCWKEQQLAEGMRQPISASIGPGTSIIEAAYDIRNVSLDDISARLVDRGSATCPWGPDRAALVAGQRTSDG